MFSTSVSRCFIFCQAKLVLPAETAQSRTTTSKARQTTTASVLRDPSIAERTPLHTPPVHPSLEFCPLRRRPQRREDAASASSTLNSDWRRTFENGNGWRAWTPPLIVYVSACRLRTTTVEGQESRYSSPQCRTFNSLPECLSQFKMQWGRAPGKLNDPLTLVASYQKARWPRLCSCLTDVGWW